MVKQSRNLVWWIKVTYLKVLYLTLPYNIRYLRYLRDDETKVDLRSLGLEQLPGAL